MLYRLLKIVVRIGTKLYYKEIKVKNKQFLEHDGPVIIIANHPNSLMDAWIVGFASRKPIYFLAKGTFFNAPIKKWFLNSLNLIPINRAVDGKTDGVKNEDSFEACYKVLEKGNTLLIFPEGNSTLERQLRQLKSGTARIALEAENRNNGTLNIKVVPMGLFYSKAEKFRSSVFVNLEQGISVKDYLEDYKIDRQHAVKKLTEKFRIHLERVLLTTESPEQEHLIEGIYSIIHANKSKDVETNSTLMIAIKNKIEEIQLVQPYILEEIQDILYRINWQSDKLKLKTDILNKRYKSRKYITQLALSFAFILLGFPLFLFGFIQNILPFKLTSYLLSKLIKNVEYYAPIAILLGLVLYPLNYFLLVYFIGNIFELSFIQKLVYFTSLPLSGMFAYQFVEFIQKISYKWKYIFLVINEKEAIIEIRSMRKKLEKLLNI